MTPWLHLGCAARSRIISGFRTAIARIRDSSWERLCRGLCPGEDSRRLDQARRTSEDYEQEWLRFKLTGKFPYDYEAGSWASFRFRTTALRVIARRRIAAVLDSDPTGMADPESMDDARLARIILRRLNADWIRATDGERTFRRKVRSKKLGFGGLGDDPENAIVAAAAAHCNATFQLHIAANLVFGSRPCEHTLGIVLHAAESPGAEFLVARIAGGKVTEGTGQPWRLIKVTPRSRAARLLYDTVLAAGGKLELRCAKAKPIQDAFTRAAKAAFPRCSRTLSMYSSRNEFGAYMRSLGNPEATAEALGHASAVSQCYYGTWNRRTSRSRDPVVQVSAPRAVRRLQERARPRPRVASSALAPGLAA